MSPYSLDSRSSAIFQGMGYSTSDEHVENPAGSRVKIGLSPRDKIIASSENT